jgi:hypothetical protein
LNSAHKMFQYIVTKYNEDMEISKCYDRHVRLNRKKNLSNLGKSKNKYREDHMFGRKETMTRHKVKVRNNNKKGLSCPIFFLKEAFPHKFAGGTIFFSSSPAVVSPGRVEFSLLWRLKIPCNPPFFSFPQSKRLYSRKIALSVVPL